MVASALDGSMRASHQRRGLHVARQNAPGVELASERSKLTILGQVWRGFNQQLIKGWTHCDSAGSESERRGHSMILGSLLLPTLLDPRQCHWPRLKLDVDEP